MTLEQAYDYRFTYGEHAGKTLREVLNVAPTYIGSLRVMRKRWSGKKPDSLDEALGILCEKHYAEIETAWKAVELEGEK